MYNLKVVELIFPDLVKHGILTEGTAREITEEIKADPAKFDAEVEELHPEMLKNVQEEYASTDDAYLHYRLATNRAIEIALRRRVQAERTKV